jgi:hypothetical protein
VIPLPAVAGVLRALDPDAVGSGSAAAVGEHAARRMMVRAMRPPLVRRALMVVILARPDETRMSLC